MRKSIALGTFAALAAGSAGAGALDSVPSMKGSDTLKDITTSIVANCSALATYPTDNDPAKAGNQPIVYDGTGSGNGENEMKKSPASQLIAPMSRALGTGICDSAADRTGAEGIVFALDGLSIAFGKVFGGSYTDGIDFTKSDGTVPATPGTSTNLWRTVLREVYTGMGASGNNIYTRDCNSASRKAIVNNWDNLFAGANPGNICTDSNPGADVEPGLRHAFRRTEESGTTDVFLAQLGLPAVNFQQTGLSSSTGVIPTGSTTTQQNIYRGLANSPFCNVHRPEDDYNPTSMQVNGVTSFIPPVWQVGVPSGAGTGTGFAAYDPALGTNARYLSPYMPEMQDQDPIRRKCIGSKQTVSESGGGPREEVCEADGTLGVVLPIDPPPAITTAQRYPSIQCDNGSDFQYAPAPKRTTGDSVRCPNGDAAVDGQCLTPVRPIAAAPGYAFDCLNNGLNVPASFVDQDGTGADFPDAPLTDAAQNADGRAYNLVLRAADGAVRLVNRPNPMAIGTMQVPVIGAYYRIHSSRSGLVAPAHTRTCASQDDATDQIGCLVQINPCSLGYAGGGAITNNQGPTDAEKTIAAPVNGVAVSNTSVQALIVGGTTYPIARKLYVNSLKGFETLLNSDTTTAPGKDAELDLATCMANLPFSTAATYGTAVNVASPFGFVPLPAPAVGGNAKALCEDFNNASCSGAVNTDGCQGNPAGLPSSSCTNGYRDGIETAVDTCPTGTTCQANGACQ